ncbi:MAG: DUF2809 domain-containing protein [Candidatus Latescibacterota bacterium]|nr:MAG: DUF2809 domain-containing protein [Candidatus Latescibacterota bacterium]
MEQRAVSYLHRHTPTIVSLILLLMAGFFSKFYEGPAQGWANDSLAGLFYVIFWCVLAAFFLPRVKPIKIVVGVLVITCCLECLQLWHPPVLEDLRRSFLGRALLGTSFVWSDFPYYLAGSTIGWLWIVRLRRVESRLG